MAAGLPLVLGAVLAIFGSFMAGLAYADWCTRDIVLTKH